MSKFICHDCEKESEHTSYEEETDKKLLLCIDCQRERVWINMNKYYGGHDIEEPDK